MSTGRYNVIKLNDLYISEDGTANTDPCKTEVIGLDALRFDFTGVTVIALDGTPLNQVFDNYKRGLPLTIRIFQTLDTRLDELVTLLTTLVSSSASILVQITGSTGTFAVNCLPLFPKPLEFTGEFQNSQVKDITLNLTVLSKGNILTASAGSYAQTGNAVTLTYSGA